eukprot:1593952-Amphidinium_carterae.5
MFRVFSATSVKYDALFLASHFEQEDCRLEQRKKRHMELYNNKPPKQDPYSLVQRPIPLQA